METKQTDSRKKKILLYSTGKLITEKQTGGTKRFLELAEYLCKKTDAVVCSRDSKEDLEKRGIKQFKQLNAASNRIPRLFFFVFGLFLSNRKVVDEIVGKNFDRVISFDVPPTVGLCLKKLKNIVLMIRKDLIGYEYAINPQKSLCRWVKIRFLSMCEAFCMTHVKTIIVQCQYDKDIMLKRHPLIKEKTESKFQIQINNVNPSWTIKKSNTDAVDFKKTGFVIGFVGNFNDGRKGHDLLLEAAKCLIQDGENISFWIIGGGKELDFYKKKYSSSKIIFWGHQDNPIQFVKRCDLMIVPSKADSCPNTVLEALFNYVVVIGSRAGGIPELLKDDEALFDISAEDLYKSIKTLLSDPDSIDRLRRRQSIRRNELCFNWAEQIEKLL